MDKYKKLAVNTVIFAIGTFSSKILSFLLMPFITKVMGTGEYGAADLVQQTANVLIPVVTLAVNSAALRFALDKAADKRDVFTTGIRTTFVGFAIFLVFIPVFPLIKVNDFVLGDYTLLIYLFVLVSSMRQLCQQFVRGCGHVRLFAIDGILATATNLGFTLLYLGVFHWGVTGYVMSIITSDALSVLFLFWRGHLAGQIKWKGNNPIVRKNMLKYCIPLIPTIILWWIINVSNRYLVTYFIGLDANGLYTAASKIPNFVVMFSSIFIDAWQLSAVDEYDSEDRAKFFTNIFRIYSGGVFTVASALILFDQFITTILVSDSYYTSWEYVPVLIIATTFSCLVNFLASIYMAEKKSVMSMVTAMLGAVMNVVVSLILIPRIGTVGAAVGTAVSFITVFVARVINTRKYVKIDFKFGQMIPQVIILIVQTVVLLKLRSGVLMYVIEAALTVVMVLFNVKIIRELAELLLGKAKELLKRKKS
ncbi:MAG TPA: polysaccharide biosynthesis C-terminal domain-containing protein [Candidatus Scubalenecus merdavium]|uniref:Polysaccharide biosynthesis C-terminal domain-containing protein n=1 Tax=Candidatus Scybalenecus merdavium TaxID=2840939 RepID=A0A9D1MU96_9FIRM|nr:polysaccharide biosynthesis C-terminal domain-containing protein [Candidatus Scubalenecus merdavium]